MSVNSLMIPCIDSQYTHEYIANVFWNQRIAKVSSVTLLPFINSKEYNVAYISVDEWCDSEVSYNFIKRLNNTNVETRVIYNDDNWWTVYRCSEMRHCFTGKSITFNSSYFEKDAVEEEKEPCELYDWLLFIESHQPLLVCISSEQKECSDWKMFTEYLNKQHRPIKGMFNDVYTQEDAEAHLLMLKQYSKQHPQLNRDDDLIEQEIKHIQNELLIHKAVSKSQNVTQRRFRFSDKLC